ncbi:MULTISPECIES: hypothetical protein [Fusobacterium]|jgi:hypothetical protein|uniref:hypothetical protein n=1 Tax=Fusobacterium TaxID=848 RepID=UPI000E83F1B3|nr:MULTISPECIES: hypothetical protein [Fusobacterium]HBJ79751.1 hypothetical protein [Fusobacterium sp.]
MTIKEFIKNASIVKISELLVYDRQHNLCRFERYIAKNEDKYLLIFLEGIKNQSSSGICLINLFDKDSEYLEKILYDYPIILEYRKFEVNKDTFNLETFLEHVNNVFDDGGIDNEILEEFLLDNVSALKYAKKVIETNNDYISKFFKVAEI